MKSSRIACFSVMGAMLLSAVTPPHLSFAAESANTVSAQKGHVAEQVESKPADIALTGDGALQGKLLDSQGTAVAEASVVVFSDGNQVAAAKTDQDGEFQFEGLRGGLYIIASKQGGRLFRVWSSRTKPPSAQDVAVIYNDKTIVRGNLGQPLDWFRSPVVVGSTIAGSIALPIALKDNEAS